MANNMDKLTQFGEQIRKYVSDDVAEQYMGLAARWVSGEIRMDKFDRRGRRLNVPTDVHTNFMIEIGDLFDIPFEDPNNRLIKKKSRKRKNPGSSSTSCTNATSSPISSPRSRDSAPRKTGNELSTRLVLFALTNGIDAQSGLLATSSNTQDKAQDFANNVLFYASLAKTPHKITETGFIVTESQIDYSIITELDVCDALDKYDFLLSNAEKRKLLTDSLKTSYC
ncbi:hypothetical protein M3Y97_00288500 [Aphelenchoides bicaudatus]|nr:hypothetical protein M3Y97_00288500 [Aphelenchoides bicaudatus]